jgi:hypothetical protein
MASFRLIRTGAASRGTRIERGGSDAPIRHPRFRSSRLRALVLLPKVARGEPPSPHFLSSYETTSKIERDDGDIDEEDRVGLRVGGQPGAADVHGQSWLSLVGFGRQLYSGKNDIGAGLVLALALDRMAEGPVHKLSEPSPPVRRAVVEPCPAFPDVARARLRHRGMANLRPWGRRRPRIDSIIARSRASALLPETRVRAMRLFTDAQHTTLLATTDATNYYDAIGANLVLEARLTWRLDRLVYAGDEPTLERARLERQEARSRLGTRTLEALFAWERAPRRARSRAERSGEARELAANRASRRHARRSDRGLVLDSRRAALTLSRRVVMAQGAVTLREKPHAERNTRQR